MFLYLKNEKIYIKSSNCNSTTNFGKDLISQFSFNLMETNFPFRFYQHWYSFETFSKLLLGKRLQDVSITSSSWMITVNKRFQWRIQRYWKKISEEIINNCINNIIKQFNVDLLLILSNMQFAVVLYTPSAVMSIYYSNEVMLIKLRSDLLISS